jgi:hypothetical protein
MVYLCSMRIHIWDIWRSIIWCIYVVYVWTWSKCEDIGIRYIFINFVVSTLLHTLQGQRMSLTKIWNT